MSAFGYTYMIQLNDAETAPYNNEGRDYLDKLAQDIHYSMPIVKGTTSIYKGRDVTRELSDLATQAVEAWRNQSAP